MQKGIRRKVFVLLLSFTSLSFNASIAWSGQGLIPTSEAISNQVVNLFSPSILINNEIAEQVSSIGHSLLPPDSTGGVPKYRFHVIYDSTPNSFSLPSGDIFVTTGLLDLVQSKDELAMVLGREIAFLEDDIGWRSYRQEQSKETMTTVATIVLAGIIMYFQVSAMLKAAEENPSEIPSSSPAYNVLYNIAIPIPEMILKLTRNSRLNKARLPAEAMMGREDVPTTFDMFLVRTMSEGYGELAELSADERALHLAFKEGWNPEAQLSLLERLVPSDPTIMLHLRSCLAKRIVQTEIELQKIQSNIGGEK
jgi:hypothetical protein